MPGINMHVIINGREYHLDNCRRLPELLAEKQLDRLPVVVEINGTIIPRDQYPVTPIREGDRLEIVRLLGGG